MLEEMKEVLISEMQQELNQKKQIEEEIKRLVKERDQKQQQAFQTLSKLELNIQTLNNKLFYRIFHGKEMKKLYSVYTNTSNNVREEIKMLNEKIEASYQKIYNLSHDEALVEKEIEKIKQASSFQEIGLTERSALNYIKNDEKKVVRTVFKSIKDNQKLETIADINKAINDLYQTNVSPFVVAMQKISFNDLSQELIDIGIVIERDKVQFLKKLKEYIAAPNDIQLEYSQEQTDYLNQNFYNQVEQDLAKMKRYSSYPPIAISKIVTLAILVSIAKTNIRQNQSQK